MARSLLEKLKELERTAGVRRVSEAVAPAGEARESSPLARANCPESPREAELADAGFQAIPTPHGPVWVRETGFDLCTHYGGRPFADFLSCDLGRLSRLAKADLAPERMVFYDIEATGLGHGGGTVPFLHALGYFADDEFRVAQYFVPDYAAEGAAVRLLAERFAQKDGVIVTYNGKSYDWPLFVNRCVLYGLHPPEPAHLDLLHPARRLWKGVVGRMKLADVEGVLGVKREGDVPGREAPLRYFAYVEGAPLASMEDVFAHNLRDVCTLARLALEIAEALEERRSWSHAAPHVGLATWFDAWREWESADAQFRRAVEQEDADWRARWLFSLFLKRRGQWEEASSIWLELANDFPHRPEPLVEVAKYFEHRRRDLAKALEAAQAAQARMDGAAREYGEIARRIERIRRKLEREAACQADARRLL
ncbi:ribonuclease H-like domain-containing protein [Alicyclobacillus sendaiensis]|uniref:ribonuclease H-like domain-containing protein n=1 Tax=Alicyclobacillus sendaiensis TaxID=192387 RepID=UPI000780B977|nr:ribonuclease H-like domain-containing protein [Alicyclobacillus sendaiensis]